MADHSPADCAGLRCACHRPHPFDLPLLGVEMKRSLWIGISLILAAIICLSFLRPHEMVSPGNLIPAHSTLQNNCFACPAPFQGASARSEEHTSELQSLMRISYPVFCLKKKIKNT